MIYRLTSNPVLFLPNYRLGGLRRKYENDEKMNLLVFETLTYAVNLLRAFMMVCRQTG